MKKERTTAGALHPDGADPPPAAEEPAIVQLAEQMATRRDVTFALVPRLAECLAAERREHALPASAREDPRLKHVLRLGSALEEALRHLPAEDAIALFERVDPLLLARRAWLFEYLTDLTVPFYTLDELAEIIDQYLQHRERNRDLLLQTGYPNTSFARSPWLDWHLSPLFPVKLPVSVFARPANLPAPYHQAKGLVSFGEAHVFFTKGWLPKDQDGNLVYSYTWATRAGGIDWSVDSPQVLQGYGEKKCREPVEVCSYEEAAYLERFPEVIATELAGLRFSVLQSELHILRLCLANLRARDPRRVWKQVSGFAGDLLAGDAAAGWRSLDDLYDRLDLPGDIALRFGQPAPCHVTGGLAALLEVISHCEAELRIGALDRTKERLAGALSDLGGIRSYFQAIGCPTQRMVDNALDCFWDLYEREMEFRRRFHARLAEVEKPEPELKTRAAPAPEQVGLSIATWRKLERFMVSQLRQATERRSIFRQKGEAWEVAFEGKSFTLDNALGLRYISILLTSPERLIHVADLVAEVSGGPGVPYPGPEVLQSVRLGDNRQLVAGDEAALAHEDRIWRAEMDRQRQQIADAKRRGDSVTAEKLERLLANWTKGHSAQFGKGGKPRELADRYKSMRQSVRKAISASRAKIRKQSEPLYLHLKESIRLGTSCIYQPKQPIKWKL